MGTPPPLNPPNPEKMMDYTLTRSAGLISKENADYGIGTNHFHLGGGLNLRGYVDFSCLATTCLNTPATVNQSQIGVDTIDTNDLEIEISNCCFNIFH